MTQCKSGLFKSWQIKAWQAGALLIATVVATVGLGNFESAGAQQKEPPPSREAVQYSFAPIVRKAAPAVVNVYVRSRCLLYTSPSPRD